MCHLSPYKAVTHSQQPSSPLAISLILLGQWAVGGAAKRCASVSCRDCDELIVSTTDIRRATIDNEEREMNAQQQHNTHTNCPSYNTQTPGTVAYSVQEDILPAASTRPHSTHTVSLVLATPVTYSGVRVPSSCSVHSDTQL